eukprot:TCONS_00030390-protein
MNLLWYFAVIFSNIFCQTVHTKSLFIWKGTRWCGYGSELGLNEDNSTLLIPTLLPTNKSDSLKINKKVDLCCKAHDHCEHYVPRWKTKYGLVNWRPFTLSSCECDAKFLKCLEKDNSLSAKDIKRIYFDILEVPCFRLVLKDVRKCVKRTWFMACEKYAMKTRLRAVISSVEEYNGLQKLT